jgi:undecaprenyl-phosphate alpha-N-acetylglucosaminyl 1-phosphatetransferase
MVMTRMLIPVAHHMELIDYPGKHRTHARPTPLVGGISIYLTLVFTVTYAALDGIQVFSEYPTILLFSVLFLVLISGIDDRRELKVSTRFLAQAFSGILLVIISGTLLNNFGNWSALLVIHSLWLGICITLVALIGSMNAMNMIDGVDGLAGGIGLISLVLLSVVAWRANLAVDFSMLIACCGAVCGFLVYNMQWGKRQYASVFLGDVGSVFLGFIIGAYLIRLSQAPVNAMLPATALWLFAVPLMDTICIILLRLFRKQSPVKASHDHLHHILKQTGMSTNSVVLSILTLHLAFGLTGCIGLFYAIPEQTMFLMFLLSFAVFLVVRQYLYNYSQTHCRTEIGANPPIKGGLTK